METFNVIIYCTITYVVISFLTYLYDLIFYWKKRGVPHIITLPFISGSIFNALKSQPINENARSIYKLFPNSQYYGRINSYSPTIVVRDPELIREICITNFNNFTDHLGFITSTFDPIFGRNVMSLKGLEWKEMRGTLSQSFSASKMKFLFELVSKCAEDHADFYLKNPGAAECINMKDAFTRYTSDVIATSSFGLSINSLVDPTNELYMRGRCATDFSDYSRALVYVLSMFAPRLMRHLGFTFLRKDTNSFFINLIADTIKMRQEKGIVRPDMLHLLMNAENKHGNRLSIQDITAQAFIFFAAGIETTASHLSTICHELVINPEIQEKLHQEIDEVISKNSGKISYEALSEMKYMDMVMKEGLRKYPPLPVSDRVCTKRFSFPPSESGFSKYTADAGMRIHLPIYGIHHDPKYYPNPEKFDPERFSDENKNSIVSGAYFPFGIGPRTCIAARFATMQSKILLSHILLNFVIKSTSRTRNPIVFSSATILEAEGGFWNKFESRTKKIK